jgi:hypothetical protein
MSNQKKRLTDAGGKEVGYRRPPEHSQFKPGRGGNVKGRPKGARNFKTDLRETLNSLVKVTRNGKRTRISTQEAALLRLREKALSGDSRALERLIRLAQDNNNEESAAVCDPSANDRQILKIYADRVLRGAVGPYHTATDDES